MKRMARLMTIAAVSVWVAGCSDIFRTSYDYARVVVKATDQEGAGVPGVRLTLYNGVMHFEYGVTRADGSYAFEFVPAGGYGVEAGAPGGYQWPAGALPYRLLEVQQGDVRAVAFEFEAPE